MELRINRETVTAAETVFDGIQEQGVELDYILPDYYPDIFRLVRCEVVPSVTNYSVSGGRLNYELVCSIRILYCSEESSVLRCVSQRQCFSKSVELSELCGTPTVTLVPKADHVNYRAVNKRRLDLRGAVSIKIRVDGEKAHELISGAEGCHIQLKKIPVRYAAKKLTAQKSIQLMEETELPTTQPPVINIVASRCTVRECEKKMISGKLLVKGNADAEVLYSCEDDSGSGALEAMSYGIPFSQIIDIDGLDDSCECTVNAEAVCCEITPSADKNGDNRVLKTELELRIICRAVKTASVMVVEDAYSTVHPCEVKTTAVMAEQMPVTMTENFRCSAKLAEGENVPQTVYGMWCTPKNINAHLSDDGQMLVISGMLTYTSAVRDMNGMISMPDKDETFEETVQLDRELSGGGIGCEVEVVGVSYNMGADNVLTASAELRAVISSKASESVMGVTDIFVDDSVKKQRDGDYAIKLYYGTENEEVWDIAKRYSTCVSSVIEENELTGDRLRSGGMLLIPIMN